MYLTLPFRAPYDESAAMAVLAVHAVPGVERADPAAGTYERLLPSGRGAVRVHIRFLARAVEVEATGDDVDADTITRVVRRWLDLDADPIVIDASLAADPVLAALVAARPGLRVIGHPVGFEAACSTVLGQQVSLAACRTFAARLAAAFGEPGQDGLTLFPTATRLAAIDSEELRAAVGITGARARTLSALSAACADGLEIGFESDARAAGRALLALPGIGPWTVDYLTVRAFGDRNAFVPGDLVLKRALGRISTREAEIRSRLWSPYRAYALFQLWTAAAYLP